MPSGGVEFQTTLHLTVDMQGEAVGVGGMGVRLPLYCSSAALSDW